MFSSIYILFCITVHWMVPVISVICWCEVNHTLSVFQWKIEDCDYGHYLVLRREQGMIVFLFECVMAILCTVFVLFQVFLLAMVTPEFFILKILIILFSRQWQRQQMWIKTLVAEDSLNRMFCPRLGFIKYTGISNYTALTGKWAPWDQAWRQSMMSWAGEEECT